MSCNEVGCEIILRVSNFVLFLIVYVYMRVSVGTGVPRKEHQDSSNGVTGVLGTEFRPLERVVCALNYSAIHAASDVIVY